MGPHGVAIEFGIVDQAVLMWTVEQDSAVTARCGDSRSKRRVPGSGSAPRHRLQSLHQLKLLEVELLLLLVLIELLEGPLVLGLGIMMGCCMVEYRSSCIWTSGSLVLVLLLLVLLLQQQGLLLLLLLVLLLS